MIISTIQKLYNYLLNKKSELNRLNVNDILLAKTVLDIHRKKIKSEFIFVPLYSIEPIHPIDRENAINATINRAKIIEKQKDEILTSRIVDREILGKHLPSISWIKVVKLNENQYVSFEGNGRIEALKRVFNQNDSIMLEVELYIFRNMKKVARRINRVRRHNRTVDIPKSESS